VPPPRFPPPWSIVERPESFAITDATGQALAHVYFEDEKGRRDVMNRLTRDEARRILSNDDEFRKQADEVRTEGHLTCACSMTRRSFAFSARK
jgi:hypothetical protein